VSLLWNNMTYVQNTHRFRGFKLVFADRLKFSLIEYVLLCMHADNVHWRILLVHWRSIENWRMKIVKVSHCWGTSLPYGWDIRRAGHNPQRGPSADWRVLTNISILLIFGYITKTGNYCWYYWFISNILVLNWTFPRFILYRLKHLQLYNLITAIGLLRTFQWAHYMDNENTN
jgi:hypothetical protein